MWEIVQAGGPFMWPLILCSIGAAAIVLERLWTLQRKRVLPTELTEQVWKWLSANQVNDKLITALEQNSPLGKVLAVGLANRHRPREVMIERLQDTGRHVVHELERFLNTLGTIATISTLLGLFGTIVGMIEIFGSQNPAGGGNPAQLAHGISVALYNTLFGIGVAIPAVIFYRHFRNKVDVMVIDMESQAIKLIEIIHGERRA